MPDAGATLRRRHAAGSCRRRRLARRHGHGTRAHPFRSLAEVEGVSRARDRIVVLPPAGRARSTAASSCGRGSGSRRGPVGEASPTRGAAHEHERHLDGDAVRLAEAPSCATDLRYRARRRVYGRTSAVRILGNDVSGHNTSARAGFHIPPFNVPTRCPASASRSPTASTTAGPGSWSTPPAASGTVVSAATASTTPTAATASTSAPGGTRGIAHRVRNTVTDLRQGADFESILAIGLQTRDARAPDGEARPQPPVRPRQRRGPRRRADRRRLRGRVRQPERAVAHRRVDHPQHLHARRGAAAASPPTGWSSSSMGDGSRGHGDRPRLAVLRHARRRHRAARARAPTPHLQLTLESVVARRSTGFARHRHRQHDRHPGQQRRLPASAPAAAPATSSSPRCATASSPTAPTTASPSAPRSPTAAARPRRSRLDVAETHDHRQPRRQHPHRQLTGLRTLGWRSKTRTSATARRRRRPGWPTSASRTSARSGAAAIDIGGGALGSRRRQLPRRRQRSRSTSIGDFDVSAPHNWWGEPGRPGPGRSVSRRRQPRHGGAPRRRASELRPLARLTHAQKACQSRRKVLTSLHRR